MYHFVMIFIVSTSQNNQMSSQIFDFMWWSTNAGLSGSDGTIGHGVYRNTEFVLNRVLQPHILDYIIVHFY